MIEFDPNGITEMGAEVDNVEDLAVTGNSGFDDARNVSFRGTGDSSFDSLMKEVDQFVSETGQLTELARAEAAARALSTESEGYTYNTGDVGLDNLLNKTQRELSEYTNLVNQARMEVGPGKYLSIDDAINQAGSNGLSDFIQQRLEWMERATPEQLRQYSNELNWRHEIEVVRAHERDLLKERSDLQERFIKHQTEDQFNAEKAGYRQIYPWDTYRGYTGDPNLFEKDGEIYRLTPGKGNGMERICG